MRQKHGSSLIKQTQKKGMKGRFYLCSISKCQISKTKTKTVRHFFKKKKEKTKHRSKNQITTKYLRIREKNQRQN